jgi:iron(III) transport system permease protein
MAARAQTRSATTAHWVRSYGSRVFSAFGLILTGALLILVTYPLIAMVIRELFRNAQFNFAAVETVLGDARFFNAVRNTAGLIAVAGTIAIALGALFAWLNERTDARMDKLAAALPLVPLVLPSIALNIGWIFLADQQAGMLNSALRNLLGLVGLRLETGPLDIHTWYGMVFLYTIWFVSFVYILISAALRNIDPALEEASRISGASIRRTFRMVSLPAILPAIGGACFLLLLLGVAQFSIGRTIGVAARVDVLSVYLVRLFQGFPPKQDAAVVVGLLVLSVVLTAWVLERHLTTQLGHATISGRSASASVVRLGRPVRWAARAAMITYLSVASVIPLGALVLVALQPFWSPDIDFSRLSLKNFGDFFTGRLFRGAMVNSLTLAVTGATIGMLIAALLVSFARFSGGRTARVVDAVARAPGAISHVVIAVAFLLAFGGPPFRLAGTFMILITVYVIMAMPQAWISARQAIGQIGQPLLDASAISGSSTLGTFVRINLPLMLGGLTAGWAMLFVVMVGDLTASAVLANFNTPVVGSVILEVFDSGTYAQLAALGATIALISGTIITLVLTFARRFSAGADVGSA